MIKLHNDDCINILNNMDDNTIDSLVTDPPAGIAFMNKAFDTFNSLDHFQESMKDIFIECHRVLKPGAHGLVWAMSKTSHHTAMALEKSGFEIRDIVHHLFGSGFPKSMNIGKKFDKQAGVKREVIGIDQDFLAKNPNALNCGFTGSSALQIIKMHNEGVKELPDGRSVEFTYELLMKKKESGSHGNITAPETDLAKQWDGWHTALKSAVEHWILVRKPLSEKNICKNIERWGVGGINVDATRVPFDGESPCHGSGTAMPSYSLDPVTGIDHNPINGGVTPLSGRFPSNLIHDGSDSVEKEFLDQAGVRSSGLIKKDNNYKVSVFGRIYPGHNTGNTYGGTGSVSRYFYCAKASTKERNLGMTDGQKNIHPTLKSIKLMEYLVKLITPPKGIVLDPFMGSGTTGIACKRLDKSFIGIEKETDYFKIAEQRIGN